MDNPDRVYYLKNRALKSIACQLTGRRAPTGTVLHRLEDLLRQTGIPLYRA